ncbi:MAG: aldehyde reductase [Chloroflexota bacterium]
MKNERVLVTGAGGFVAVHCIIQLLEQGYPVRGTLRDLEREPDLRATLSRFVDAGDRLELVEADLLEDEGWGAAMRGCAYALHVASPFPLREPENEDDLIQPAVDGTRRVLRAAAEAGVRRVVQTSSIAAVIYGHGPDKHYFTESDWSNTAAPIGGYVRSKTLAERAAWEFVQHLPEAHPMELAVINPGWVLGPLPDTRQRTSGELILQLLKGQPGVARNHYNGVDVRDVAAAHLAAMTRPEAAGQRFICVGTNFWMKDAAVILREHFRSRGYNVRTNEIPSWLIRLLALFDPTIRLTVPSLDWWVEPSSERIRKVLGWRPRGLEEMIVSMAESLIELKVV